MSAGVLDALAAGAALVPRCLSLVAFEACCAETIRGDIRKMAPNNNATSLSERVTNCSIALIRPRNGHVESQNQAIDGSGSPTSSIASSNLSLSAWSFQTS
jgi:hypothetical protein